MQKILFLTWILEIDLKSFREYFVLGLNVNEQLSLHLHSLGKDAEEEEEEEEDAVFDDIGNQ